MSNASIVSRYAIVIGLFLFAARAAFHYANGDLSAPLIADEGDYLDRGRALATDGLNAISDGYRPPFFIFVVAAIYQLFGADSLIESVRLTNLAFVSAIPVLWLWAAGQQTGNYRLAFQLMAGVTALWPPFYHYGIQAEAEPVSFLLVNALVILTIGSRRAESFRNCMLIGVFGGLLLAILGLTKANNLLIAPGLALVALTQMRVPFVQRFSAVALMTIVTIMLLVPWAHLIKVETGQYKMTTTAGLVLLIGTGHHSLGMTDTFNRSSLHEDYIFSTRDFHPTPMGPSTLTREQDLALEQAPDKRSREAVAMKIATKIWLDHWHQQSVYGVLKILHSLGGSLRGLADYILAAFAVVTLVATAYCIRTGVFLPVVCLHWAMAIAGFSIAFFFLPYIRFKTFYFDASGLLLICCAATQLFASGYRTSSANSGADQ